MMDSRTTAAITFRAKLGINRHDPMLTKEQSIGLEIMEVFSEEEIIEKYFVSNERIDFYLRRPKLATEVNELGLWTEMKKMK